MIAITPTLKCVPDRGWGFIYMYTFDNGKRYIGQTVQAIRIRHKNHVNGHKSAVDNAMKKHGYKLKILHHLPENELDYAESYFIQMFDSVAPNGYNLSLGGQTHRHHSDISKSKMSQQRLGRKLTPEWKLHISEATKGEKNPMYGKTHSADTRRKLSEAKIGNTHAGKSIINLDTGEVFEKMKDVITKYGGDPSTLTKVCKGGYGRRTFQGYHWRYLNDTNSE